MSAVVKVRDREAVAHLLRLLHTPWQSHPDASAQGFLWQIFGLCILLLGPFLTCDFLLHFDSQKPFNNSAQACIFVGGAEAEEHSDTNDLMRNIFLGSIMQPPVK